VNVQTYLITQGKFLILLKAFIAVLIISFSACSFPGALPCASLPHTL
jgi:hypothetical protein